MPSHEVFSHQWGEFRLDDEMGPLSTRQPVMAHRGSLGHRGAMDGRNTHCDVRYHSRLGFTSHQRELLLASATPINKKYPKIKGDCTPYDPAWELYLEERLGVKMEKSLQGKRRWTFLWKEQGGICPICSQPITQVTGWHNHHIVYKTLGGTDGVENRVLI